MCWSSSSYYGSTYYGSTYYAPQVLVVIFGVCALGDPITPTSGFGVCIAIGGGPAWSKRPPWLRPSSTPVPPQDAPGSSRWLGTPRGEAGPLGAPPLPRVLELAASTTAHFPAVDHPGGLWYAQERKRLDEAARRGGGGGDIAEQKKDQPAPESAVTRTLAPTRTRTRTRT